jgi:Rrf2 family nitric oxide-sensitive transcriptional repressor
MVPAECFDDEESCAIASVCRLRGILADAMKAFYAVLAQYSLDDVIVNRCELAPILFRATGATGKT